MTTAPPSENAPVVITTSEKGRRRRTIGKIAAIVLLVLIVAGIVVRAVSPTTLDSAQVQQKIMATYPTLKSVNCPDGVEVKTGKTFDCAAVLPDGSNATVTVREINDKPDVVATLHR